MVNSILRSRSLVGLSELNSMLSMPGPTHHPDVCASLHRTGVPHDGPLEGQCPWEFAIITPGKARPIFFNFGGLGECCTECVMSSMDAASHCIRLYVNNDCRNQASPHILSF